MLLDRGKQHQETIRQNIMPILFHDFETKSTLDLREVGAWRYTSDTTTDVWCCAFAVDDGPIQLWIPGDPVPTEFIEAAQNPNWVTSAFGDHFERLITQHIMGPRYGWPAVPIERRRCSQAASLALALPAKLGSVAQVLKLEHQKDDAGRRAMMQMAQPRRPRKDENPNGVYWFDDPERREQLYTYCKNDVAVERALHHRIEGLIPEEHGVWQLDSVINDRGMYIDGKLLDAAIDIAETAQAAINTELTAITEGELATIGQTTKLIEWLAARGCVVTDVQKTTIKRALTRKSLSPEVRRVMELRLDGAHAAAAKLETMRAWRNGDGRARGTFRYHGASTGRWTSFGIQVQNMKRPEVEDIGAAIEAVATGDLDHLRHQYPRPMSVVGDVARAMICAAPGHRLIAADFSGIESRVTAWISGQQSKIEQWAKFDRTGDPKDEPYFILGKQVGQPDETARGIGKTADLAFGYMGSINAWKKLAGKDDTSTDAEIKQRQRAWRRAHPNTGRFWGAINRAAIQAVRKPNSVVQCGRIAFKSDGTFLRMKLPSGRKLAYPFPRLKTTKFGDLAVVFMDNQGGKWTECRYGLGAYGGTWIENAVQAVARDLFAAAMPRLEAAGYPIVLHVHDEIVVEAPAGVGSVEEFQQIMTTPPAWAEGLPIAAKVRNGERFCKIEAPRAAEPIPVQQSSTNTAPDPKFFNKADKVIKIAVMMTGPILSNIGPVLKKRRAAATVTTARSAARSTPTRRRAASSTPTGTIIVLAATDMAGSMMIWMLMTLCSRGSRRTERRTIKRRTAPARCGCGSRRYRFWAEPERAICPKSARSILPHSRPRSIRSCAFIHAARSALPAIPVSLRSCATPSPMRRAESSASH